MLAATNVLLIDPVCGYGMMLYIRRDIRQYHRDYKRNGNNLESMQFGIKKSTTMHHRKSLLHILSIKNAFCILNKNHFNLLKILTVVLLPNRTDSNMESR